MFDLQKAHYLVVTGIIIKDGKYLITRRPLTEKAFPGMWTVPGGKLEMSDYIDKPKDTADHWYNILEKLLRREVAEETSLKIKNIRYLASMVYIRPDGIPTVIISLFADWTSGKIKLSNELVDYAWVTLEEARGYELIEGIYEELEMLDKKNKGIEVGEWVKV